MTNTCARLACQIQLFVRHASIPDGEFLLRGQGVRDGHTLEICSGHAPGVHSETDINDLKLGEFGRRQAQNAVAARRRCGWRRLQGRVRRPGAVYF